MRHRNSGKRLGRSTSHRKAMLRNLVTSLLAHEKITTTDARAKAVRPLAEKLITMAKRGDLHARRQAAEVIRDKQTVAKLFDRLGPRFADRPGGYTRIVKLGHRLGDNAAQSMIVLVDEPCTLNPKQKAPVAAAVKPAAPVAAPAVEEAPAAVAEVSAAEEAPAVAAAEESQDA